MRSQEFKLDNPVWYSLNETHKDFAIDLNGLKFYHPDYCPFGGLKIDHQLTHASRQFPNSVENFYLFGEKPRFNDDLALGETLTCHQMLLNNPIETKISEHIIELKSPGQKAELYELVHAALPTLYKHKSSLLGKHYGIYKKDRLVAIIGERLKMNAFTEISSVVTHEDHRGKGYAKQLLKFATDQIFNENKTPYLHVVESNTGAINLYKKLGFYTRRTIKCWNIIPRNQKKVAFG